MKLSIYGSSDDLLEIEGDFSEEYNVLSEAGEGFKIGFSDGTLIAVEYNEDGIWRLVPLVKGRAKCTRSTPNLSKDEYSDVITLELPNSNFKWIMIGQQGHLIKTKSI